MNSSSTTHLPLFVKRDLDGFFGLFVDNLVQLLLIVYLVAEHCGMKDGSDLLLRFILPGAAVSLLVGNLFYAWQAHRLAKREGRDDVTALPYGINTPSLLVYIFFVMKPVYMTTGSAELAWKMGLIACLGSGVIEFLGAFIADGIRKRTPRAALLSTLAGIAIGFIAMTFALQIFHRPLVAMLPLGLILITYFSGVGFPLGLPGGFVAVLVGTFCAWGLPWILPESMIGAEMSATAVQQAWRWKGWYAPTFVGETVWELLSSPKEWFGYLSVIVPMGLFNLMGSLQNIESAAAGGDNYQTAPSLMANGLGTIIAALFGSCFPTTIYIGHPGWKGLGARAGYSTLNGIVITMICLTGTVGVISKLIPIEAGIAIVLWIGIIMTAQAFQVTEKSHAPAVAIGLFPAIAAWGATVMQGAFIAGSASSGVTLERLLTENFSAEANGFLIHGLIIMERGYIFTCMILAAIAAFLIERRFYLASIWSLMAAFITYIGLIHAYRLDGNIIDYLFRFSTPYLKSFQYRGDNLVVGYLLFAWLFALFGFRQQKREKKVEVQRGLEE